MRWDLWLMAVPTGSCLGAVPWRDFIQNLPSFHLPVEAQIRNQDSDQSQEAEFVCLLIQALRLHVRRSLCTTSHCSVGFPRALRRIIFIFSLQTPNQIPYSVAEIHYFVNCNQPSLVTVLKSRQKRSISDFQEPGRLWSLVLKASIGVVLNLAASIRICLVVCKTWSARGIIAQQRKMLCFPGAKHIPQPTEAIQSAWVTAQNAWCPLILIEMIHNK